MNIKNQLLRSKLRGIKLEIPQLPSREFILSPLIMFRINSAEVLRINPTTEFLSA